MVVSRVEQVQFAGMLGQVRWCDEVCIVTECDGYIQLHCKCYYCHLLPLTNSNGANFKYLMVNLTHLSKGVKCFNWFFLSIIVTLMLLENASNIPTFLVLICRLTEPSMVKQSPSWRTSLLLSTIATPAMVSCK